MDEITYKTFNHEEFMPNCGPDGRGYGAWYLNGDILFSAAPNPYQKYKMNVIDWNIKIKLFDDIWDKDTSRYIFTSQYIFKQIGAQIGDRMALGIVKNFQEIEDWVLDNCSSEVIHNNDFWFFENPDEAILFKLTWV